MKKKLKLLKWSCRDYKKGQYGNCIYQDNCDNVKLRLVRKKLKPDCDGNFKEYDK